MDSDSETEGTEGRGRQALPGGGGSWGHAVKAYLGPGSLLLVLFAGGEHL